VFPKPTLGNFLKSTNYFKIECEVKVSEMRMILERDGFIQSFLDRFKAESVKSAPGLFQFRLKAFQGDNLLWEYQGATGKVIPTEIENIKREVLEAIDTCGASELRVSFSAYNEEKKVEAVNWNEWFLDKVYLKYLIPDTNFIYRHYCSNVLYRHLGSDFNQLIFRLPRLVILEIEKRGNLASEERSRDKRLAFYAVREIEFLKQKANFELLSNIDASLMSSFTEKAGRKLIDMWIRKEIHDNIDRGYLGRHGDAIFLTCDLMNALAAEAEGLNTCYFSWLPQDSFFVEDDNSEQLFDLILATAIIFEEIKLDVILVGDTVHRSLILRGMWNGKTTSQWFTDCIQVETIA
jgi:hypothetical protein